MFSTSAVNEAKLRKFDFKNFIADAQKEVIDVLKLDLQLTKLGSRTYPLEQVALQSLKDVPGVSAPFLFNFFICCTALG